MTGTGTVPPPPPPAAVRHLLLRGGELDGRRWVASIAVGRRLVCAPGPWTTGHVYVVTDEVVVDDDGGRHSVAVPAVFAPARTTADAGSSDPAPA